MSPEPYSDAGVHEAQNMSADEFRVRLLYELDQIREEQRTKGYYQRITYWIVTTINGTFATLVMGVLRGWF